jgi:valyl-tRNA synthetase
MLPDNYNTREVEAKWQKLWQENQVYKWDESLPRAENYVIDTPPPTVSGLLHMGHIFSFTQLDFIARFQRMYGKNVFFPMGFDDNGLPTERLVEKVKGIKAVQLPRKEFIKLCQEVVVEAEEEFRGLFREIALSVDWAQEYQTISPEVRRISQLSFMDLFQKKAVKRRNAPTFWDPVDRTAIAQAEIEDKEKNGVMNDIIFATLDGKELVIATTRPELISACVALLYHPEDKRYKKLAGKKALTPIFKHEIPILEDADVDIEKGTGLVMCCTFGDIQDIHWWRKHNLPIKDCIALDGKMKNAASYDGLYVKEARAKILEDLKAANLVVKQTEVTQFVKCAERSGAPLEIIPTQQWYVKILDIKEQIISKANECNWYPEYMKVRLENWVNGLNQDWCISRQRYFGVPFPIWYSKRSGEEGKILIADADQLPVDPLVDLPKGYTRDEVQADEDVMDTWATSSLTPQINSRVINEKFGPDYARHQKLFPADLRSQAHEIIRTWAFYTLVKSHYHQDTIPWKNLMISGWCLAADKTKMSKSKGNVVTPLALIVEQGADAVRYWASNSKLGVDIAYSEDAFKIGKRLSTKLWNASKFVAIHLEKLKEKPINPMADVNAGLITESLDLWVLSKLYKAVEKATTSLLEYEYNDARVAAEEFFWKDFCDNYLELIKARTYNEEAQGLKAKNSAIHTIYHCLHTLYRLFAPFMPYITEELNEKIFADGSVHQKGSWPDSKQYYFDQDNVAEGEKVVAVLELIRKFKSNANISLRAPLNLVEVYGCNLSESATYDLKNAANAKEIAFISEVKSDDFIESESGEIKVRVAVD